MSQGKERSELKGFLINKQVFGRQNPVGKYIALAFNLISNQINAN